VDERRKKRRDKLRVPLGAQGFEPPHIVGLRRSEVVLLARGGGEIILKMMFGFEDSVPSARS